MSTDWNITAVRNLFPALRRTLDRQEVAFLDGPAGSQVPQSVADAVSHYLLNTNANMGAVHATSRESDAVLAKAHQTLADFLGTDDADSICFGANMTTITLALSRTLAQRWNPGDEIIVSQLDHDANVTPWVLAAREAGVHVHHIPLRPGDYTLDMDRYRSFLNDRTQLVAVGYASNATGTINPVHEIVEAAHSVGALAFVDAVHYAPHGRIQVNRLDCDFLTCSAYKFFGPHLGVLYGRRELLENIRPYKLRPSTDQLPGKWMTGTQNHEGIAGAAAAVRYLESLHNGMNDHEGCGNCDGSSRSAKLDAAFRRIRSYETLLSEQFLRGARGIPGMQIYGITDPERLEERVPTFSMTFHSHSPADVAKRLSAQGIFAWAGNHYALPFTEAAGLEPSGTLRIGALHYNTPEEIERVLNCLRELAA